MARAAVSSALAARKVARVTISSAPSGQARVAISSALTFTETPQSLPEQPFRALLWHRGMQVQAEFVSPSAGGEGLPKPSDPALRRCEVQIWEDGGQEAATLLKGQEIISTKQAKKALERQKSCGYWLRSPEGGGGRADTKLHRRKVVEGVQEKPESHPASHPTIQPRLAL